MKKIRLVTGLFTVVAVLAMALPVTVGACPAEPGGKACCCTKAPKAGRRCCCPRPAQPSPGSSCAIQKARPDAAGADAPPDPTPLGAGVLAAAPSLALPDSTLGAPCLARIEPGWDPGNHGFLIPLRL